MLEQARIRISTGINTLENGKKVYVTEMGFSHIMTEKLKKEFGKRINWSNQKINEKTIHF